MPIRAERIAADIDALAAITEPGRPWTRRAFTPLFLEGRTWLQSAMQAAGAVTEIDPAGNLVATVHGQRPDLGIIMIGSHSDTVPDGGRYDGIAGVIAGLEVMRALRDQGWVLDHTLQVVDFLAEEVSVFGVSCIGSRGMSGTRPREWLDRESGGLTLRQGIANVGGDPLKDAARADVKAFLELHIEQGPVLDNEKIDIGIVTAIAGITRVEVLIEGRADHAGTTPMGSRRDALVAAAAVTLRIEEAARKLAQGTAHFAATVGEFDVQPNAANVVPSRVRMLVDARAARREDMELFLDTLALIAKDIAAVSGVTISMPRVVSDSKPTACDPALLRVLDDASEAVGARHRRMASGAGHDTAWMARITRAAMIFVPCRGGRSHAPDEAAAPEEIAVGTAVLLEAIMKLDRKQEVE